MKKLILTSIALVAGVTLGYSQGAVTIANTASGFLISTNATAIGGGIGLAGTGANSYYYAVLASAYGGSAPSTVNTALTSSTWIYTGILAPNNTFTKGGVGNPSTVTTAGNTFGAPAGGTYSTAATEYYVIVGWSANEGTTWATVENELANNSLVQGGYFGVSPLAYNEAGGGPDSLPTINLLNGGSSASGLAGSGLTGGFQLPVVVPEPTTLALAGLGGLSLLALRRKKA